MSVIKKSHAYFSLVSSVYLTLCKFINKKILFSILVIYFTALVGLVQAQTCNLTIKSTVSGCYQNSGSSKATVSIEVSWENATISPTANDASDAISVTFGGQTKAINPGAYTSTGGNGTIVSPQVVAFEVPADASAQTAQAFIGSSYTTSTCKVQQTGIILPAACLPVLCIPGQTGGTVWNDFNADGIKQSGETTGIAGVSVKAYDCVGVLIASTTTDESGKYVFTNIPLPSYPIRVEFSDLLAYAGQGTVNGSDGRTTVQFVNAADCTVDLGVLDNNDYCQTNPKIIIPCYLNGDPQDAGSATDGAIVSYDYSGISLSNTGVKTVLAKIPEVGTVWGEAYNKYDKQLYTAAFLRRHSGLGPLGLGGIYKTDVTTGTSITLVDVTTIGVNLGTIGSNSSRGLGAKASPNVDAEAFAKVGKVGMGDIDISEDGQMLFFVNLFEKKLHRLDVNNPTSAPGVVIPDPACGGGTYRPWGIKFYKGKVYVGVICDGETSQNKSDLRAYVYQYDVASNTFSSTPVFDFPLTYPKGFAAIQNTNITGWYPWTDDFDVLVAANVQSPVSTIIYPQPVLSDIEFDVDGSMVLGFLDRMGLQIGSNQPDPSGNGIYSGVVGGDILRAYKQGDAFILENNAKAGPATGYGPGNNQGPGSGEFYNDDFIYSGGLGHSENGQGGMAIRPGSGETVYTAMDALDGDNFNLGGFRKVSNTTGLSTGAQIVVQGYLSEGVFAKAASLGDVELTCDLPTYIEIGNRVWDDTDKDGIQGPCEEVLTGVNVSLYKGAMLIASTSTDVNGEYYFSTKSKIGAGWTGTGADTTLLPNTSYKLVFGEGQITSGKLTLAGLGQFDLTIKDATANNGIDQNDSDAELISGAFCINLTTGSLASVNHTFDVGFVLNLVCTIASVTALPTTCNPNNNQYAVSGQVTFTNPPTTGTLTVSITGGSSQVFNAPLTSPINYSIVGQTSDGLVKTVTATFSALLSCTNTTTYTAPSNCTPTGTCNCKEYIYLNEPALKTVLKFEIGSGVPLTEVLGVNGGSLPEQHWYPGTGVSELPFPHGLATDLNGNLFVGSIANPGGQLRKFSCDGAISAVDPTTITTQFILTNMFSIGNIIYTTRNGGPAAYNSCTGALIGTMCLNDQNGDPMPSATTGFSNWGLSYNPTTEMVYVTQNTLRGNVWVFTRAQLEAAIAGGPCIDPFIPLGTNAVVNPGDNFLPDSPGNIFGITSDNAGNIYIVKVPATGSYIMKYNAAGQYVSESPTSPLNGPYAVTIGIVWSETTNRLYVSNSTDDATADCISAFDATTMAYLGAAAPNPNLPTNNTPKAIAILKECCPVNLPSAFQREVCGAIGTKFYLNQEAFDDCDGTVCGSSWTPTSLNGMTFDPCDNSVTVTGVGCSTFTLGIGAVASTGCGPQNSTFTICNNLPSASFTPLSGTCNAAGPNNDARINVINATYANQAGISAGNTYTGPAYGGVGTISLAGGSGTFTGLMHVTVYTIRVFNGSNECYVDFQVNSPSLECCNISSIVPQNITCYDNGTPGQITDNKIRFSANITNSNALLTSYNVTISGGTTITPNTNVPYGITQFTLGAGTAGSGGTFTITFTDSTTPGCTEFFTITDPGNCAPSVPLCPPVQCGTATIQVNGN